MSSQPRSTDLAAEPLARGSSIGRYMVLGLVGRGGMGEVYAAFDPELDRKVAVKLLRVKAGNGVSMTEGRQRTLREAQAIARLSHPNVVVVYDVGTFNDQVFIAMEFVDGNTATYWVQAEPRTWKEILKVYVAAGQGLMAAHEKGLVHRDFKPDNVMVGKTGQVRVMDFGLARQIGPKPLSGARGAQPVHRTTAKFGDAEVKDAGTMLLQQAPGGDGVVQDVQSTSGLFDARLTRTGAMMGTPAYMAPEQFFGTVTDARTDQFSFCVSLYEALYGDRPFAGNKMQELTGNVVQGHVREAPAGTKVPQWVRRILQRGLRPAAAERFPSMAELLAELGKDPNARRRKIAVVVAAPILLLSFGFAMRQSVIDRRPMCDGGTDKLAGVWELPRADGAEGLREAQIHQAFLETGKSYAADVFATVSRALTGYAQSWSNMYKETCEATQIRHDQSEEVLDLRMSCLQERLNGLHALTDVFVGATGEVVENAVSASNALASLDRCADVPLLRAVVRPPEDPATRSRVEAYRNRMADLKARFDAGRWRQALGEAPKLVAEIRTVGYRPLLAESLTLLGQILLKAGDHRSAEKNYVEAFSVADSARHDEVRAEVAEKLVYVVGYEEGRFDDADRWAVTARSVLERLGGRDLLRAWLLNDIGCVDILRSANADAIPVLEQSLVLKEKALGEDHPDVGLSEGNLGMAFEGLGRHLDALRHLDRSVALLQKALGAGHPDLADQLSNRGEILNALGRFEDARHSFEHAQTIWERELGMDNLNLGFALTGIGISYLGEGKPSNALVPLERAFRIRMAAEIEPSRRAETSFALARALWESSRGRDRARELASEAKADYTKAMSKEKLGEVDSWLRARS